MDMHALTNMDVLINVSGIHFLGTQDMNCDAAIYVCMYYMNVQIYMLQEKFFSKLKSILL